MKNKFLKKIFKKCCTVNCILVVFRRIVCIDQTRTWIGFRKFLFKIKWKTKNVTLSEQPKNPTENNRRKSQNRYHKHKYGAHSPGLVKATKIKCIKFCMKPTLNKNPYISYLLIQQKNCIWLWLKVVYNHKGDVQ